MSERDDGGSAFPDEEWHGMSLRDYFAAKAIEGVAERPGSIECVGYIKARAEIAYAIADALLEARKK